jgi:pimeloyl-ACP methyl ester carboxylesterase
MPAAEILEAGTGPVVGLVHSSVAGARQWRRLMEEMQDRYRLVAVSLYGYDGTPAWDGPGRQTLEDQARLVVEALPGNASNVHLVGHSLGGTVAMKAASLLGARMGRLVLLEPNPFPLLDGNGHSEAFAESLALRAWIKQCGETGNWEVAAERFADYWGGRGSWAAMTEERRVAFAGRLPPNFHEWDAVMDDPTTLEEWAQSLPAKTMLVWAENTVRPIREIAELFRECCPSWRFEKIATGGHMAPLTHPDTVNPLISSFLDRR